MKQLHYTTLHLVSGGINNRIGPIGAAIGAGVGAGTYIYSNYMSNTPISAGGLISNAAGGAAIGAFASPMAVIWGANAAMAQTIASSVSDKIHQNNLNRH